MPETFQAANRELLFTISLSRPFNDYCYKLVAGIALLPKNLGLSNR